LSGESTVSLIRELLSEIEKLKREIAELKRQRKVEYEERPRIDVNPELLAEFFSVFSSPERIMILKLLWERDRYFSEFESVLGLGPSSLRHHLSKLQRFGLVLQERARGKYVISERGRDVYLFIVDAYNRFLRGEKL